MSAGAIGVGGLAMAAGGGALLLDTSNGAGAGAGAGVASIGAAAGGAGGGDGVIGAATMMVGAGGGLDAWMVPGMSSDDGTAAWLGASAGSAEATLGGAASPGTGCSQERIMVPTLSLWLRQAKAAPAMQRTNAAAIAARRNSRPNTEWVGTLRRSSITERLGSST